MRRSIDIAGISLVFVLLAAGCHPPPPYVVDAVEEPPKVAFATRTRLVYLDQVYLIENPALQVGVREETSADEWPCVVRHVLTWAKLGQFIVPPHDMRDRFAAAFDTELAQAGVTVATDLRSQFKDLPDLRPDVIIRAKLASLDAQICWVDLRGSEPRLNRDDAYGKVWMRIIWEITSRTGEGADTITLVSIGGASATEHRVQPRDLLDSAFAQATRRLLADQRFAELVRKPSDPSAARR